MSALYKDLFQYLENNDLLDSLNEIDLFALHYVYVPRINASLAEFQSQWNHHAIRTANHQTPLTLFQKNIDLCPRDPSVVSDVTYGVDYGGPLPEMITTNNVIVPELDLHLSEEQHLFIQQRVSPLEDDGNSGINHFLEVVGIISGFFNSE